MVYVLTLVVLALIFRLLSWNNPLTEFIFLFLFYVLGVLLSVQVITPFLKGKECIINIPNEWYFLFLVLVIVVCFLLCSFFVRKENAFGISLVIFCTAWLLIITYITPENTNYGCNCTMLENCNCAEQPALPNKEDTWQYKLY